MMDFGLHSSDLTPFLNKLEKNELTLEDILEENTIIDDIKDNDNSQFINIFTNDNIKKLIDYSTKLPVTDSHNIGYKYPFNATEILCSENANLQKKLMNETPIENKDDQLKQHIKLQKGGFIPVLFKAFNKIKKEINNSNIKKEEEENNNVDEEEETDILKMEEILNIDNINEEGKNKKYIYENIDYLLQFLKEPNEAKENYVLVGYFYKILNSLINIHSMKIVQYLFDYPKKEEFDIIGLFIKHMNRKSMCNIIHKLLIFEDELISKYEDKKLCLLDKICDELNTSNDNNKIECICDLLSSVMSNTQFFDLFMTKTNLLEKLYNILIHSINNSIKINSILKLLIKINENVLEHFEVHHTSNLPEKNDNEVNPLYDENIYSNDQDKSLISHGENMENFKNFLNTLFTILEKNKFSFLDDFGNCEQKENGEFISTYMEKQKKIGIKKIIQVEYLKTIIDIFVNSYASKHHENKIEHLINLAKEKNIFWNINILFILFPFSNIYHIYYYRIMEIVLNEHTPNCLIDAFFFEYVNDKRNLIELYITNILTSMKFKFNLTNTQSFNPCFSYIISILNKIYNSQNINIKKIIESNKDISVFNEIMGEEINNIFTQKLLLNENFHFGDIEEENTSQTFFSKSLMELFEENCKIYEIYKKGEDYKTLLNQKKERIEKQKNENKNIKMKKKTSIEELDDDEDKPLFKVEKLNSNNEKDDDNNFLAILNKPKDEVNKEKDANNNNNDDNKLDLYNYLYQPGFDINDLDDNEDEKDKNNLNIDDINGETNQINDDSIPNQIENKIYHIDYNKNRDIEYDKINNEKKE